MNIVRILLTFAITVTVTVLLLRSGVDPSVLDVISYALLALALVLFGFGAYQYWLLNKSQDMNRVEAFVQRMSRHPYYRAFWALLNENWRELEQVLPRLETSSYRALVPSFRCTVLMERGEWERAREVAEEIPQAEPRAYTLALIAISQRDWETASQQKQKIKNPVLKNVLEVEEAFQRGNLEEADRLAELTLQQSGGLRKLLLLKGKEHSEKKGTERKSYF